MIGRLLLAAVLGLSLAACAKRTEPGDLAASWVGQPVGALIASWGVPDKIEDDLGGHRVYSWHAERRYVQPPQCSSTGFRSVGPCIPGRVLILGCDFEFEADAEGEILAASGRGDCLPLRRLSPPGF
ncbi:MAG: hypothetical protein QNJ30_11200 [Kiloniellales bacterium]|nr:hypothetical protein [Kiloniellales bacterium]